MYYSRRRWLLPLPPLPERHSMRMWSMKFMGPQRWGNAGRMGVQAANAYRILSNVVALAYDLMAMKTLRSLLFLTTTFFLTFSGKAQVFIPCIELRNAINAQVPGLVDQDGMMDVSDPNVLEIDTLQLTFTTVGSIADLTGIDQLPALTWLTVSIQEDPAADTLRLPDLPGALEQLVISGRNEVIELGALPATMEHLNIYQMAPMPGSGGVLSIESFPEYIPYVYLSNLFELEWSDTARVGTFAIQNWVEISAIVLPDVLTSSALINVLCASLDISRLGTRVLNLSDFVVMNAVTWPSHIEKLTGISLQIPTSSGWPEVLDTLSIDL